MNEFDAEATFDCLYISSFLEQNKQYFVIQEVHLFAYLACLLWLYHRESISEWGYSFIGTELGAPVSTEIDQALNRLHDGGYFIATNGRLRTTTQARRTLEILSQLKMNGSRIECLQAACSTTAAFSEGMVSSALSNEPDLFRAQNVPANRFLLEEGARAQLYEQFDTLRNALKYNGTDLRLPAVVWLNALYRSNEDAHVEL